VGVVDCAALMGVSMDESVGLTSFIGVSFGAGELSFEIIDWKSSVEGVRTTIMSWRIRPFWRPFLFFEGFSGGAAGGVGFC
jgi:hypothetical protein